MRFVQRERVFCCLVGRINGKKGKGKGEWEALRRRDVGKAIEKQMDE